MSFDRGAPAFWFVEITLDGETLRHSNAFEPITFDGQVYEALGDRFTAPADIDRAANLKSQKFKLKYDSSRQTDNADPIGKILDSNWKRRPIRVRYAVGDMDADGFDFSDPTIIADETGRIKDLEDTLQSGDAPALEMEIESGALIFLERRNQTRSPANQRAAFADDAFFDFARKLDGVVLPWRTKKARNGTVQITYNVAGVASREMLIGRGLTKGSFVFGCTIGQERKYWNQVYALADHQCAALEQLYINGVDVLAGESALVHGVKKSLAAFNSGGTRLWLTWYDGRHNQTADAYLIAGTAAQTFKWTSAHRGRGVSYCVIEHLWDSDNDESYAYEFVVKGAKIYQERLDTTAGGSGAHRLDDPDTWTWTENPEEALRHYLRGRVVSPASTYKWFGVGAPDAFLDPYSLYSYRAAHCEAAEDLKEGGTQQRYTANGWLSAADSHAKNIQKLADCMVADPVDEGGRISIRLSEPQTPVVELFDSDLMEDEETVVGVNARGDDVINRVEGQFSNPDNKYSAEDYSAIENEAFEEIDGEQITGSWKQELETSEERAQRKATLYLNKMRRTLEIEETFGLKAKDVRPGDWISRSSALRGFPLGKLFIAAEVRRFVDGTVRLILLEVDPAELVWTAESAILTPATETPGLEVIELDPPEPVIEPVSLASGGAIVPALTVTREDLVDDYALAINVELALDAGSGTPAGPVRSYVFAPGGSLVETITNLLPATAYVIRFRYADGLVLGPWGDWIQFETTADFQALTASAPTPESALAEALATATAARDALAELILSLNVRLDETREGLADLGRINGVPIGTLLDQIRREIVALDEALSSQIDVVAARIDDAEAAIVAETIARTTALTAEAQARALIAVRLQNAESSILNERSARVTADLAITEDLASLEAGLTNVATGQTGTAQALQGLTTRVRANELELDTLAASVTSVSALANSLNGNLTGQAISIASLTSRVRSSELGLQSVSSSLTSLSSEVSGLNANFGGLADALTLIEAAINEAGGSIDVSLSSITSLGAQVEALAGSVSGNGSAINTLTTRVSATEGQIESTSTSLTALSSTVDGLNSTLTIQASTLATLDGRVATFYGIRGVSGSSEFEFVAMAPGGDAPSSITLRADQIRLAGQVILQGTVTETELAEGAATERALFTGSSVSLASNAAFTNILSGNIPTAGGTVELEFETDVILTASQTVGFRVEIVVNGTLRRVLNYYLVGLFTHTIQGFARFTCSDGDSLVIRAKVQRSEGVGQAGASVSNVTARSIEFKR